MKTAEVDYDVFDDSFHVQCRVDQEIINLYRSFGCKRLVLDYHSTNVEKLSDLGDSVERLYIKNDEISDLSFVHSFTNLRQIESKISINSIDLSKFSFLKSLGLSCSKVDSLHLLLCKGLEDLDLTGVKLINYKALGELKNLKSLNLVRTLGWDLDLIKSLEKLETLGIYNLKSANCEFFHHSKSLNSLLIALSPQLETLEGLPTRSLVSLSLRTCKNLTSIKTKDGFPKLEEVILESCPELRTLEPLLSAQNLKILELWERTSVADGKLRRMLSNPNLQRFTFLNRDHYDLKSKDINL